MSEQTTFDHWALVEVMGHRRYAGRVTEQQIGGASFIRVDVPEVGEIPAYTKFLGAGSIYCITPCSEDTARRAAASFRVIPFASFEAPRLPAPAGHFDDEGDQDDDFDDEDIG